MSLAEDLLQQADQLCSFDPGRPKQANLRRAISASYYALFHLLVGDAVALLLPARLQSLRNQLARKFTHGQMKKVAQASSTMPGPLALVASAFVTLQEARHEADYDLNRSFTKHEAKDHIDRARDALREWRQAQNAPDAVQFLMELLVGKL